MNGQLANWPTGQLANWPPGRHNMTNHMTRHQRSALYGAGIMGAYFLLIFNTHISFQSCNRRSTMGHLHDGVILLPRPECFVKMLSYPNLSPPLWRKRSNWKISLTIEATDSILVLVVKWRHHANGLLTFVVLAGNIFWNGCMHEYICFVPSHGWKEWTKK